MDNLATVKKREVESPYLTEGEAVAYLRGAVALNTLRKWRTEGSGPTCFRVGKTWLYTVKYLDDFVVKNEIQLVA